MGIKLGSYEEVLDLVPEENGVEVFLAKLPEYEESDKGYKTITFPFKGAKATNSGFFSPRIFDMFDNPKSEKAQLGQLQRLSHIYSAFMSAENYRNFIVMDFDSLEDVANKAKSMIDPAIFNIPLKIMFGFNDKGHLSFPFFGSVISSPLQEKPATLVFNPKLISLKLTQAMLNAGTNKPDSEKAEDNGGLI